MIQNRNFYYIIYVLALVAIFRIASASGADNSKAVMGNNSLTDWEQSPAFSDLMETSVAIIHGIYFEQPPAGQPCRVSAKITFDNAGTSATISAVELVYSVDASPAIILDMVEENDKTWTASIPGQDTGTKIQFYTRIVDTNGNVTSGAIPSSSIPAQGEPDLDDSEREIHSRSDLTTISANYDDEYLYVNFEVKGEIHGGTTEPPDVQAYAIKVTNPDTDAGTGLIYGKIWVFVPVITDKNEFVCMCVMLGPEPCYCEDEKYREMLETGMAVLDVEKLLDGKMEEWIMADAAPSAEIEKGSFKGKVKRATFGDNPSGYYRIIVLTAVNKSIDSFMPVPQDSSNFLTLYTSSYEYVVE